MRNTHFILLFGDLDKTFSLGNTHASMALLSLNHDLICLCGAGTRPDFYDFGKVAQPRMP